MTPQERQMIDELFDKLAKLERAPRDSEASAAIAQGLRRAPNSVYALTQTVLVQDEALRRANDRIEELEQGHSDQRPAGGFLDTMREALTGAGSSRGSVPSVRSSQSGEAKWNTGQVMPQGDRQQNDRQYGSQNGPYAGAQPAGGAGFGGGGGSSFLGTAAAAATGMIGGSLLMNGIRGLMGGSSGNQQAFGDSNSMSDGHRNPSSGDNLSREAGLNDVGKNNSENRSDQSSTDQAMRDADQDQDQDQDDEDGFDSGDDSGDSDYA